MTLYLLFLVDISLFSSSVGASDLDRGDEISNVELLYVSKRTTLVIMH